MSDTFSRVEVIAGVAQRRHSTTEQKLAVLAETMQPDTSTGCCVRSDSRDDEPDNQDE